MATNPWSVTLGIALVHVEIGLNQRSTRFLPWVESFLPAHSIFMKVSCLLEHGLGMPNLSIAVEMSVLEFWPYLSI